MQNADDPRWTGLTGGYRTPFDPRPSLARLETDSHTDEAWRELWEELHHQGDVGDASCAAVPLLVEIERKRAIADWNSYALVAIIELARTNSRNPDLPEWLAPDYFRSIRELAEIGAKEILRTQEQEDEAARAILSIIAVAKGLRTHAKFLVEYSEDEMKGIELGQ